MPTARKVKKRPVGKGAKFDPKIHTERRRTPPDAYAISSHTSPLYQHLTGGKKVRMTEAGAVELFGLKRRRFMRRKESLGKVGEGALDRRIPSVTTTVVSKTKKGRPTALAKDSMTYYADLRAKSEKAHPYRRYAISTKKEKKKK